MFCSNCGKMIPEGAGICPSCGLNIAGMNQQSSEPVRQMSFEVLEKTDTAQNTMPIEQPMAEVQLSKPVSIDNGIFANGSDDWNSGLDAGGYNYQQNPEQNAGRYGYQQDLERNAGGYNYQQDPEQNAGGYGYQQNYAQNAANFENQPQDSRMNGYYDGFKAGSTEGFSGNAGEPGQAGSSGGWIASMILGILSIVIGLFGGWAFGVIGAGVGVALGIAGLIIAINYRKANGTGATAGLVTSIIGFSLSLVFLLGCAACGSISDGYGYFGCIGGSWFLKSRSDTLFNSLNNY